MITHPTYHVVAAIVVHQGEVLCVQKPQTKYSYTSFHWEYPGGKVEANETEPQALKRELMEEMDYPITVVGLLSNVEYNYPDFAVSLRFYLCYPENALSPRQLTLKEHVCCQWVKLYEVPFVGQWCAADYILPADPTIVDKLGGTCFQHDVWRAICTIPYGQTRTYSQLAQLSGHPTAIRAVASACRVNPLPYYIPCHRVVGKHDLGGYAFGLLAKQRLLSTERKRNN